MHLLFQYKQITKLLLFVLPFAAIAETDYEPNNTSIDARPIMKAQYSAFSETYEYYFDNEFVELEENIYRQSHDFVDANDEDWMVFEIDSIFHYYPISVINVGQDVNPDFEIYDWAGRLIDKVNYGLAGEAENTSLNPDSSGIYYIRVFNSETEFGENAQYEIGIDELTPETDSPENGRFSGSVYDRCTQMPIDYATVSVDSFADQALSINGGYVMYLFPGTFEITVNKIGYQKQTKTVTVDSFDPSGMNFDLLPDAGCSNIPAPPPPPPPPPVPAPVPAPVPVQVKDLEGITARYDDLSRTLIIDDIEYEADHYRAELINSGDFTFSLKSANKLEGQSLQNQNIFDLASSSLKLKKVLAFDKHYKVVLKHLGDLIFKLESAEESE